MFSTNMKTLYKRWLILGLLVACLGVFGFSDITQITSAAPCYQECENHLKQCIDSCKSSCSEDNGATDADCFDCKFACDNTYWNCVSVAVHCGNNYTYTAQCEFRYDLHCPNSDCSDPNAHYGYHEVCKTIGDNSCTVCPTHPGPNYRCQTQENYLNCTGPF